jgi:hypothetical protein
MSTVLDLDNGRSAARIELTGHYLLVQNRGEKGAWFRRELHILGAAPTDVGEAPRLVPSRRPLRLLESAHNRRELRALLRRCLGLDAPELAG